MGNPILPNIIVGPAIVTWNGKSFYSKAGIKAEFKRETFKVETDFDGQIDERMKTQMTEVSFQPDGQMSTLTKYFPYAVTDIGKSIFGATPLPLVIQTKFGGASNTGQTITYPRAALSKLPQLRLKPTDTLFGEMTFTCLGNPTVQPNTSNAWQTIADAAFGDCSTEWIGQPGPDVSTPPAGSVTIQLGDANGRDLYIQQLPICMNGVPGKMYFLCSNFEPDDA